MDDTGDLLPPSQSLAAALHFLQSEWNGFARDRAKWNQHRAQLEAKVAELEGQRRADAVTQRDLLRRIKMLESALINARKKASPDAVEQEASQVEQVQTAWESSVRQPLEAKLRKVREGRELLIGYLREVGCTEKVIASQAERMRLKLDNWPPTLPVEQSEPQLDNTSFRSAGSSNTSPIKLATRGNFSYGTAASEPAPDASPLATADRSSPEAADADAEAAALDSLDAMLQDEDFDEEEETMGERVAIAQGAAAPPLVLTPDAGDTDDNNDNNDDPFAAMDEGQLASMVSKQFGKKGSKMMSRMGGKGKICKAPRAQDIFGGAEDDGLGVLADVTSAAVEVPDESVVALNAGSTDTLKGKTSWRQCFVLKSHLMTINAVACHPTDPVMVTAANDGTAKVWWLPPVKKSTNYKVEPVTTLRGHQGPVLAVVLNTDGDTCYTGGADGTIRAWSVPDESATASDAFVNLQQDTFEGHRGPVVSLAMLDDRTLMSASQDGTCCIWTADGSRCAEWQCPDDDGANPTCIRLLQHNPQVCVVTYETGRTFLFDVNTGKMTKALVSVSDELKASPATVVASPSGMDVVAIGHADHSIRIVDTNTGKMTSHMVAHTDAVAGLAFDNNNKYLLSCSTGRNIRVWDATSFRCCEDITAHRQGDDESITAVQWIGGLGESVFTSVGADGIARVFCLG
eukprot:m.57885 g.57885  ORF g.57885 m.57885 type:complete len:687 (-) comp13752_c0_seq1:52-2112(-)